MTTADEWTAEWRTESAGGQVLPWFDAVSGIIFAVSTATRHTAIT